VALSRYASTSQSSIVLNDQSVTHRQNFVNLGRDLTIACSKSEGVAF
jgi:hypothetical protein